MSTATSTSSRASSRGDRARGKRDVGPSASLSDPLEIAADVVVVSREHAEGWGRVPGTALFDALTEGRVLART